MNLWFRLLIMMVGTVQAAPLPGMGSVSRIKLRVWPGDLDISLHVNNGRYLTLMDVGRFNLILRTGTLRILRANGWLPVMAGASIHFRRELRLWQPFWLESEVVSWDEDWFLFEHRILVKGRDGAETVAAIASMRGGFFDGKTRKRVPVQAFLDAAGVREAAPVIPHHMLAAQAADVALRQAARGKGG